MAYNGSSYSGTSLSDAQALGAFSSLGLSSTAYVKADVLDGEHVWTIHQADGTRVGIAPSRELAFAAIREHDLVPVSVH